MKLANLFKLNLIALMIAVNPVANADTTDTTTPATTTQIDTLTSSAETPRNDTNVTPTAQEDKIITASILKQIQSSPILSKLTLDVQTNQGVVTLSGNLDADTQASALVQLAQSTIGVKDVNTDNLVVKASSQPLTDTLITAKIKGLLIREDVFGTKDIASINMSVETKDGVVYLSGAVDNQEQIKNAIKLIEGVKGVKKVEYQMKKVMPTATKKVSPTAGGLTF